MVTAILIDVLPLDVFEEQVWLTGGRDAGVNQVRDVGMCETRENIAFAFESFLASAPEKRDVQEFDRCVPFEATIAASGQPDGAHSSLANRRLQRVGAHRLSSKRRWSKGRLRAQLEKPLFMERLVLLEQRLQISGERRILLLE